MDKNTLIGLLLMGLVIFGFTWLNQPSPEEIAESKRISQTAAADNNVADEVIFIDSISAADVDVIRRTVQAYGKAEGTAEDATYSLSNDKMSLMVSKGQISGSLALPDTVVAVEKIIDKTIDATLYSAASKALKDAVFTAGKYRDFTPFVNGVDSTIVVENKHIRVDFSTKGGVISQVTLKDYDAYSANKQEKEDELVMFDAKTNDYGFILNSTDQRFDTKDLYFAPSMPNDSTVVMTLNLANGASWALRYTIPANDYIVKMEVVQNGMSKVIPQSIAEMGFKWHQKMSRHEQGRMFEERNSTIYYKYAGGDVDYMSETESDDKRLSDKVQWIAFKNQFFSSVLIADKPFTSVDLKTKVFEKGTADNFAYLKDMNVNSVLEYSSATEVPASFHFYFGPNLFSLLDSYDDTLAADGESLELTHLIPLGWSFFRGINTYFIIPIFDFLAGWVSNYGVVILLMTLLIKLVLFPLTYKSMKSQAKMRILAPDIKAINDKYPGQENALKRQQETMALYSRAGASPFSGCLPMLLQMPILFAMFTFFPSCIELRGESFLWVKDLSAPDAIVSWTGQIPFITNYFGNHISLFCLLMTATNIIYTHINMQNQSGNQMPGMKFVMYLMPIMFLVFFNNYAAGLSYYYFLSLLITIVTTYAFRFVVKEEDVRAEMAAAAKKPKKKSGFMARLEEMQRQQQAQLREQQRRNGRK